VEISIIGCGGVGTHLALPLMKYAENYENNLARVNGWGDGENLVIHFIDGDIFEEKNLNRQLVNESGIGINKARWLGGFCNLFAGKNTRINIIEEYVTEENVDKIPYGFVFNCVDNNATRHLIEKYRQDMIYSNGMCIINGGNETFDGNVYVSNSSNKSIFDIHKEIAEPKDNNPGISCDEAVKETPQISVANNMVAALMLVQFYKALETDGREIIHEDKSELYFDIRNGEVAGYDRRKVIGD